MMERSSLGTAPKRELSALTVIVDKADRRSAYDLMYLESTALWQAVQRKHGLERGNARLKIRNFRLGMQTGCELVVEWVVFEREGDDYAQRVTSEPVQTWEEAGLWAPILYWQQRPKEILPYPALWRRDTNPSRWTGEGDPPADVNPDILPALEAQRPVMTR